MFHQTNQIMNPEKFTTEQIELLKSKGFKQEYNQHSGLFFIEEEGKTYILVPSYGKFEINVRELLEDGDSGYYEEWTKLSGEPGQPLEDFLNGLGF